MPTSTVDNRYKYPTTRVPRESYSFVTIIADERLWRTRMICMYRYLVGVECPEGLVWPHKGVPVPSAQASAHRIVADQGPSIFRLGRGALEDLEPRDTVPSASEWRSRKLPSIAQRFLAYVGSYVLVTKFSFIGDPFSVPGMIYPLPPLRLLVTSSL